MSIQPNETAGGSIVRDEARAAVGLDENPFDCVSIAVASPDVIRKWSKGEVKNPETINYRTFKPEPGGLFCQKIFGPVRDYECACGKYKRIKYKDVVCDRCGVEVTISRVRRERMGHIELAVPVSHIWFLKSMPSRLGLLLDMTARSLERVIYYENFMVVDPGKTPLELKQLLTDVEYRQALDEYGDDAFVAKMGAEAVRDVLVKMDLEAVVAELQEQMRATRSKQIKKKLSKRLKVMQGFIHSKTRPEWMVLEVLPVIPPDLRPLVPLEGGRFATSDLNDLYRRVINRNNRLRNLMQLKTPDVIIHNEKRMLQEAADALFDNGRHGRPVTGAGNRPLKSLSDMLKGKQGRFRQNLLGKRVDYSGRSVIVIGPELKLNQCGIPKKMALVLFEPFIIRRLKELGFVHTVRGARKMIEKKSPEVWDILEEVTKGHPVLLNRAPTLHRLSIQAFEPILIEGESIRIHPLVCTAYNADFDGDQMAVHVPLSLEAVLECKLLMMATNNIFSPSSGKPILTPSQDIVLGAYYLTIEPRKKVAKDQRVPLLANLQEVQFAKADGVFKFHDWIDIPNPDYQRDTVYGNKDKKILRTSVGRVIFNEIWPTGLGFINFAVAKSKLGDLILNTYKVAGHVATIEMLDKLKELGFTTAFQAGISIGIDDMIIPGAKKDIVRDARAKVAEVESQFNKGVITGGERYNKVVDIWTSATDKIAKEVFASLEANEGKNEVNPVYIMMDSGARGNRQQVRQLCGARGLMAKPSGEIIERPILSSFREGLTVLEYFISTHGARKGLADTALKTADAGYMTRKLCDVAMDVVIMEEDCGTREGIWKKAIVEGDDEIVGLKERIVGRFASDDVINPINPAEILVRSGELITEELAQKIDDVGIERVKIMSPLTCTSLVGIDAKSYGINPASSKVAKIGDSVGIIAAQSIGEPGTQLTMRTFHIGGVASGGFKMPEIRVKSPGIIRYKGLRLVQTAEGGNIVLNKTGSIQLVDDEGRELDTYNIVIGSFLHVNDGGKIAKGEILAQWDPYNVPVLSEKGGALVFKDMIPGVTVKRELDEATGRIATVVIEHKEDLNPQIEIRDGKGNPLAAYSIPVGAQIVVAESDQISPGALLAKTPRQASKTKDITGGLPRVAELFEARRPKDAAEMARIDGIVSFAGTVRGKRKLVVSNEETAQEEEHLIPTGKHIIVQPGDVVHKGQHLTEGAADPHEILEILGPAALYDFLISQVQEVYRLQGVAINDKHIEIIIRQMLRKVRITDPGDSEFFWGEQVDRNLFLTSNKRIEEAGGKPAEAEPILLGITKASLETESFISAASFQETTRVLTDASTLGKVDFLKGFKENVIMGHLIPAGTGLARFKKLKITLPLGAELPDEEPKTAEASAS
jgi:DNA-directed RNA polymerase subunit beta'